MDDLPMEIMCMICNACSRDPPWSPAHHLANLRNKEAAAVSRISYEQRLAEQEYLAASGYDTACLAQALSKAANCRTIFVEGDVNHRPWGAHSLKKLTGVEPNSTLNSLESQRLFARAIHVNFAAVAAGYVPLQRVGAPQRERAFSCARHVLRSIVQFPGLEVLRLGFDSRIQTGDLKALSEGICLKNLRVLETDTVSGTEDHLARLLLSHKFTLRDVYQGSIELPTLPSWKSLLMTIRDELCLDRLEITDFEASDHIVMFDGKQLSDSISIQGGKEALNNLIGALTLGEDDLTHCRVTEHALCPGRCQAIDYRVSLKIRKRRSESSGLFLIFAMAYSIWVSEGHMTREEKQRCGRTSARLVPVVGGSHARDDALGIESVHWIGCVALGREGRICLNLDRLGQTIVAAIKEARQAVSLHSALCLFSRLSLFFLTALCRFSQPLLFFNLRGNRVGIE
ncbi:hypothetical protein AAWM_07258 [Aspergillus awamori]|uniref:F-box domain-containing protein n=1 Tax=Aspergillus awamori TaxID=105351 RepID=A0A401KYI1_ASPAW|nr:hypothetical protein AAWM_07258 [Aspergillus awamori]